MHTKGVDIIVIEGFADGFLLLVCIFIFAFSQRDDIY